MWRPAFNSDGSRLVQNMLFKILNNTHLTNIQSANACIAYQREINVYYIVISKSTLFFPWSIWTQFGSPSCLSTEQRGYTDYGVH